MYFLLIFLQFWNLPKLPRVPRYHGFYNPDLDCTGRLDWSLTTKQQQTSNKLTIQLSEQKIKMKQEKNQQDTTKKDNKNASKKAEKPQTKVSDIQNFLGKKRLEQDEKQKTLGAKIQRNSQILFTQLSQLSSDSSSAGKNT